MAIARSYYRDKVTLFFTFAFPLIFLVVFGVLFRDQTVDGSGYIDYDRGRRAVVGGRHLGAVRRRLHPDALAARRRACG